MDRPLVVIDTETATPRGAPHLLELGAVRVVDGEVVDQFERLVRPEVPIEPESLAIHGIGEEAVRAAEPAARVLPEFSAWLGDDWLAAHDARRDARVLGFEYARAGLEPPRAPMIDTLALARRHVPEAPDHSLETLAQWLGLEGLPVHRALSDAVYCYKVLEEVLERRGGGGILLPELLRGRGGPITIAGAGPQPPRVPQRLRALEKAAREGTAVTLIYGAGEGAPASLSVQPRLLYRGRDHAYLEAECGLSGALKTYSLDRIQRVLAN